MNEISNLQLFIKNNKPFGVIYLGPTDGAITQNFLETVRNIEISISLLLGEDWEGKLISGNEIKSDALKKIISILKSLNKYQQPDTNIKTESNNTANNLPAQHSQNIKDLQIFLSQNHPIIGKLYFGSQDGIINQELISALQQIEQIIGDKINKNLHNLLVDPNAQIIHTDVSDIQQSLKLLEQHSVNKKSSLTRDDRIIAMTKILHSNSINK